MRLSIFIFFACLFLGEIHITVAQSILGGEIAVTEAKPSFTTIRVDIYSEGAYRDTMLIDWGDGSTDTLDFFGSGGALGNVYLTAYLAEHTYPDTGVYVISILDSFWVDDILNISNSGQESLLLQDTVVIHSDYLYEGPDILGTQLGVDYSPEGVLSQNLGMSFTGPVDSFVYKMITVPVSGYTFPEASNVIGFWHPQFESTFVWDKPVETGRYAVALRIYLWYNGRVMSTTTRQMTIQVDSIFSGLTYTTLGKELFRSFPNPANQQINIALHQTLKENTKLKLTNSLGAVVAMQEMPPGTRQWQIAVNDLPAGVYYVSVGGIAGQRVVVVGN